jgi:hypothetical protein
MTRFHSEMSAKERNPINQVIAVVLVLMGLQFSSGFSPTSMEFKQIAYWVK